ncbi:FAD-dependent monooxygenase [Kibdelosporangium phytohabitans]|uniref:FAD-binding monooxygenase n=1 Tax=Kibdelosporangium phytohabitans TaxID=860235 RepID=A0A0N9HU39_9PSEU|nr:FAD-dependent monooxygenase [Kibdelosporangium phytohabitans]ALG06875.1 FAD-binding monooxygenase [Kibdelosporangium phytohabitans]MBE1468126.1 tetracenomycin A2 monooxygenase-dioxygenase [Kibdelosporangium phytohabitans]
MRTREIPVLVVGAGPVGLSTAAFLAHWGVGAVVIDKRDPTAAPPRAGASLRTLELFRSIGLGPETERLSWTAATPMAGIYKDSAFGATQQVTGLPERYAKRLETCSPVDARQNMTQSEVQRLTLDYLTGRSTVRFGAELTGFEAGDTDVRAEVVDLATGETEEIVAKYLIAADGARSSVRGRLGITMPDRRVVARLNTAFFRADLGNVVEKWGTGACFVRNDSVYATLFSKNGRDQWSSHIMDYPGKPAELTELSEQRTVELLRAAIGDDGIAIDLHSVNAWEAAVGVASELRKGRVFLVGDAAHVQSSAGGLGMNTGIQDGHNLAWKIAAVLAGQAAPRLLDSYEPERLAAIDASLTLSRRMHEGYQDRVDPDRLYDTVAVDYLRGMLCYRYRSGAVADDGTADADVLADVIQPGRRFPHRWADSDRGRVSVLDLIGSRWTLLVGQPVAPDTDIQVLVLPDVIAAGGAVLVRPDGFVGWVATGADRDPKRALHRVLGHRTP